MGTYKAPADYYAILEVPCNASVDDIKKSYKRLALLHHPDKNGGTKTATERFQLILEAWETLGDEGKRRMYDASFSSSERNWNGGTSSSSANPTQATYARHPARTKEEEDEEESARKRQQWEDWLKVHDAKLGNAKQKVDTLKKEIQALDGRDAEAQSKLEQKQAWWTVFTTWPWDTPGVPDDEKESMENERLQRNAARTVKQEMLKRAEVEFLTLSMEKFRRESEENFRRESEENERLFREHRQRKEAAERAEKENNEAQWRRFQEELLRRQRAAGERRERQEKEQQKAAEEARERAQKAEDFRREVDLQWQQLQQARMEEEVRKESQRGESNRAQPMTNDGHRGEGSGTTHTTSPQLCTHNCYWPKVQGRHFCIHCWITQSRYAFQCPNCATMACSSCMRKLKKGDATPAEDFETNYETHGHYDHDFETETFDGYD